MNADLKSTILEHVMHHEGACPCGQAARRVDGVEHPSEGATTASSRAIVICDACGRTVQYAIHAISDVSRAPVAGFGVAGLATTLH